MNAANQRHLTPILATIAGLLALLLLLLLSGIGRGVHWNPPRTLARLPPPPNTADLPRPLPLAQFAPVWQKPLFSPDRKPVVRAAEGGSNLGDFELTGIILTPGLHMVLLHDKNGNKEVRLREGASLPDGSVKLLEVHPRSAMFDSSAGRTELKLPAGAPIDAPKAGALPPPPPTPGGAAMMRVSPQTAAPGAGRTPIRMGGMRPSPHGAAAPSAQNDAPANLLERIRENAQRRRAAHAAAAHQGVR